MGQLADNSLFHDGVRQFSTKFKLKFYCHVSLEVHMTQMLSFIIIIIINLFLKNMLIRGSLDNIALLRGKNLFYSWEQNYTKNNITDVIYLLLV